MTAGLRFALIGVLTMAGPVAGQSAPAAQVEVPDTVCSASIINGDCKIEINREHPASPSGSIRMKAKAKAYIVINRRPLEDVIFTDSTTNSPPPDVLCAI
jgi:hypothetical protein